MTSPASVSGDERLRLFLALRLPDDVVAALAAWQARELAGAGRIVPPEHLHVTLAFLGSRPASELPAIVAALRESAAAARPFELAPERYRETRSVGMLVLTDASGEPARPPGSQTGCTSGWRRSASTGGRAARGSRTSPWCASASALAGARRCRSSGLSLRPTRLLTFHVCTRPGRRYEVLESFPLKLVRIRRIG